MYLPERNCLRETENVYSGKRICRPEKECMFGRENLFSGDRTCLPGRERTFRRENVPSGHRMYLPEKRFVGRREDVCLRNTYRVFPGHKLTSQSCLDVLPARNQIKTMRVIRWFDQDCAEWLENNEKHLPQKCLMLFIFLFIFLFVC